jgi:MFS family permease
VTTPAAEPESAAASLPGRPSGPLRFAPFRYLFAARLFTVVGNGVAPIALAFAVLDMSGSAVELGVVVAARSVANMAVLLVGGVVADRLPRNAVLLATSLLAAATQGTIAWLVLDGSATIPALVALSVANGAAAALSLPASSALVPQTVPTASLRGANALLRLGLNGGTIFGSVAGAALVAAVGPGWGLAIDAVGFAIAGPLFLRVGKDRSATERNRTSVFEDLRDGWREFSSRSWVWSVVAQFALVNACFVGAIAILGPVIADATFGRASWGLVVGAEAVGLAVGALISMRWQPRHALFVGVVLVAACALPVTLLAVAPVVPLLVVAFFLGGVAIEQFSVAWDVALQSHIPPDRLARVYSYDMLGSLAAMPIGQLAAGPLAVHFGTPPVLLAAAAIIVAATAATALLPAVRKL